MKLASELLVDQLLTPCVPGCDHQGEGLGPPLLDPRLYPMRPEGIDDQSPYRDPGTWRAEPPQGIQEADPLHADMLPCG
jgi:hypothetical protein